MHLLDKTNLADIPVFITSRVIVENNNNPEFLWNKYLFGMKLKLNIQFYIFKNIYIIMKIKTVALATKWNHLVEALITNWREKLTKS